jgi:hypothetical protein
MGGNLGRSEPNSIYLQECPKAAAARVLISSALSPIPAAMLTSAIRKATLFSSKTTGRGPPVRPAFRWCNASESLRRYIRCSPSQAVLSSLRLS